MKKHLLEIEDIKYIYINGIKQSILIRGCKLDSPVLLYLHGGPGVSNMYMYPYEKELEENFIVVKWDQRGTAKSYNRNINKDTFNLEQFIDDTYEVCKYITARFNKKIYLIGHSWGSLLGIKVVQKYPEMFKGYIGVGQLVHDFESEKLSYTYIFNKARLKKNKRDMYIVNEIMKLPYRTIKTADYVVKLTKKYGGSFHKKRYLYINILQLLRCKYYSKGDILRFIKGLSVAEDLSRSILSVDLFKESNKFKVPIYLFLGKYDYITSSVVAKTYFDFLEAPKKDVVVFLKSAHCPQIEEHEKFNKKVIECFLNDKS